MTIALDALDCTGKNPRMPLPQGFLASGLQRDARRLHETLLTDGDAGEVPDPEGDRRRQPAQQQHACTGHERTAAGEQR